jgi:DNA-binding transcriptional regulator YhcF (GntR family)
MQESAELHQQLLDLVSQTALRGERELPSLRDLATRFGVAPNTIKKTLLELDSEVGVYAIHGRGFFLQLPGDPDPMANGFTVEAELDEVVPDPLHIPVDESYSPVPEEGRALHKEYHSGRDCVVVVGQLGRATDPTGAPSNRFLQFVQIRQHLQSMGFQLSWAAIGYDRQGHLDGTEVKALQLQLAAMGDRLAGILLLDAGYGRKRPLWEVMCEATEQPVVWFHTTPVPDSLMPTLPPHAHVLEPDWTALGGILGHHLVSNYTPQKVILLPSPGEKGLPPQIWELREVLLKAWGPRWVCTLEWFDVFPEGLPKDPARSLAGKLRRLLLDTGLTRYELDRYFHAARSLGGSLWICADDLLGLAALDHFESHCSPNEPRPGLMGFGNHPFSLARGLSTVDPSWPTFVEKAIELFSGYGRRSKVPSYRVITAPSNSVYGGNILARSEDDL